jgi:hypothetical protein
MNNHLAKSYKLMKIPAGSSNLVRTPIEEEASL